MSDVECRVACRDGRNSGLRVGLVVRCGIGLSLHSLMWMGF